MEISIAAAAFPVRLALWALLVGFGLWVWWRVRLRSALWLEVYLLLYVPLSLAIGELFSRQLVPERIAAHRVPFGWTAGELVARWAYGRLLLDGAILLLLALLILADVIFLLRHAGVASDAPPARFLLGLRQRSLLVGLGLVALMALLPLTTAALWIA